MGHGMTIIYIAGGVAIGIPLVIFVLLFFM